jgi:NAD(P)H-flavin reductase
VELGPYQRHALSDAERASGKVLLCCASATSDLEIEYVPLADLAGPDVRQYAARVARMQKLSHDVMQVLLKLPDAEHLSFYAGQYINVLLADGDKRSFSFATAPHEQSLIELHIRRIPQGKFTSHVFEHMKEGDEVRFEGPLGSFFLREDSDKPILFVAGSTGFAPVKSMVEHAFYRGLKRRMLLYWGVRRPEDLYLPELPLRWQREHSNFHYIPVISDPRPEDHWEGRTGLVHEAILSDFPDLSGHQVYACGSAKMVEAAHPAFLAQGMAQDDCFSDAFRLASNIQSARSDLVRLGGRP